MDVAARELVARMRFDPDNQVEVPGRGVAGAPSTLPGEPDALAVHHTWRDGDVVAALSPRQRSDACVRPGRPPPGSARARPPDPRPGSALPPARGRRTCPRAGPRGRLPRIPGNRRSLHRPTAGGLTDAPPWSPGVDPFVEVVGNPAEVLAETVILLPLVRIGQHLVGLTDLFELLGRSWIRS